MATTSPYVQKLIAARNEAITLMTEHGLIDEGWRFQFSNHKTFLGMCYHEPKKIIALSQHYIYKSPADVITDTVLHEIAHALVGANHGHDYTWRRKAIEIGCDGNRTCSQGVSTAKPNYRIECPECGWSVTRYRMKQRNFGSRCPECHTTVKIYKLTR